MALLFVSRAEICIVIDGFYYTFAGESTSNADKLVHSTCHLPLVIGLKGGDMQSIFFFLSFDSREETYIAQVICLKSFS